MRYNLRSDLKYILWEIADVSYDFFVRIADYLKIFLIALAGIALLIIYGLWLIAMFLTPFALLWFILS